MERHTGPDAIGTAAASRRAAGGPASLPTETSGSDQRASRSMREPLMHVDLGAEIAALLDEDQWQSGDRNSITLLKTPSFRLLLTVLGRGGRIGDDHAQGPLSVQVVRGEATVRRGNAAVDVTPGHLATVDAGAEWWVDAVDDAALLLTVSWPEGRTGI